jgi:hypothetical protein
MKLRKSMTAALATITVIAPASTVFASSGQSSSEIQATNTSTTVPARRDTAKAEAFRASMKAWQEATRAWLNGRVAATKAHREVLAAASTTLKSALEAASTKEARKAAMDAFKSAREDAKADLDAALKALGERPERPTR